MLESDGTGSTRYEYGLLGETVCEDRVITRRAVAPESPIEAVMEYKSDYLGRMQSITYPDGEVVSYTYDAGGQVTGVTGENSSYSTSFEYVEDIGYDEYGQRVYIEYGNGVKTEYTYDAERRWLSNIETECGTGVSYQSIDYTFDTVGNVLSYTNDCSGTGTYSTSQSYSYDSLYQLTKATGTTIYGGTSAGTDTGTDCTPPYGDGGEWHADDGIPVCSGRSCIVDGGLNGDNYPVDGGQYPDYGTQYPADGVHYKLADGYTGTYSQTFAYDSAGLGNMTDKVSSETVTDNRSIGDDLNYSMDYEYATGYAHRLVRSGDRYYKYDANGNVILERDGKSTADSESERLHKVSTGDDGVYSTDYGWGTEDTESEADTLVNVSYERTYEWDERNRLVESIDSSADVHYVYGADGQRTVKYTSASETVYFNRMWTWHEDSGIYYGQYGKNIYLGETRIVTKLTTPGVQSYEEEHAREYYYHADHLGSAQLITDSDGNEYQRIEYTPYGETWAEKTNNSGTEYLTYKFTGKKLDEVRTIAGVLCEGLYYYGARYLDPKYSRWISADPALGDYILQAPTNDEAKKHNQNMPGQGGVFNTIIFNL